MYGRTAIAAALTMLLAGQGAAQTGEELPGPAVSWEQAIPARLEANFQHYKGRKRKKAKKPLAIGRWIGAVNVVVAAGPNQSLQAELRVGLGSSHGFSAQWFAAAENGKLATGVTESVPLCLTAPDVSAEDLSAWRSVRSSSNPALVIPLVPRADKPGYTNPEAIRGQVFLWDESGKEPKYARYADISVPANGLVLEMLPGPKGVTGIRFSMSDAQLEKVSRRLWRRFLADGNAKVRIRKATGAARGWIQADTSAPTINAQRPADSLDLLYRSLESIHSEGILPAAQVQHLVEELDAIAAHPERWRPVSSSTRIVEFERIVRSFRQPGALDPADADFLLQHSAAFLAATSAMGSPGFLVGSRIDYEPSTPGERTHFYVDSRSTCSPATGSAACPFPSIAAALDKAAADGLAGVELDVARGVYRDPLVITRDTVIRSAEPSEYAVLIAATTMNHSPAYLEIEGVTFITAGPDGALNISNEDAITVLSGVTILEAEKFGISQRGGELWLTDVEISGTRSAPGFPWHGTGLTITNGAIAVLNNVEIANNQSGGILADGEGTYLWGVGVELRGNRMNRYHYPDDDSLIPDFTGGLNVRGGALAELRGLRAVSNEVIGVLVREGGQAFISDAVIERSSAITGSGPPYGGIGAGAKSGGYLELRRFRLSDHALAGLIVYTGGTVALHDGDIIDNPIGANIQNEDYDTDMLRDNVRWDNDVADIDSFRIYVPTADDLLDDWDTP